MKKNRDKMLVFVCTGNVCRSPMAEYAARAELKGYGWHVLSAGISGIDGMSPSNPAVEVMAEAGIDIGGHLSRRLSRDIVNQADVIVVMGAHHMDEIVRLYPNAREKTFLLGSFSNAASPLDVEDPIGCSTSVYREVRDQIRESVPGLVEFLKHLDEVGKVNLK